MSRNRRVSLPIECSDASMGKNFIETIWGRGYVLREPTDSEARISA